MGAMYSIPYVLRKNTDNKNVAQRPLSGSQTQRGMFLNAGTKDVGPDPDWDPVTQTRRRK